MANNLPIEIVGRLKQLAADGNSLRKVARELGVSTNTARKHWPSGDHRCACGEPSGHKGWCASRYAESVARQAFQAARRGVVVVVPPVQRRSRQSEQTRVRDRWFGRGGDEVSPLATTEHFDAIEEVTRATRRMKREFRDDVRSALLLAVLEGRVGRHEILKAAPAFLFAEMRAGFNWVFRSLDEPTVAGSHITMMDLLYRDAA